MSKVMIIKYARSHLIRWLFFITSIFRSERKLIKTLRFTIGEQYENYEFVLKSKGEKIIDGICYEIYLYEKGDFKTLLNLPISRGILLLFNADILSAVYYRFQGNHFEYLLNQINKKLPSNNKMIIDPFVAYRATCHLDSNTVLELLVKKDGNTGMALKNNRI
ncbi:hypothetical protein [Tenacibaculum maritimum]|uniref:hypothetical protein n=1 Tax=Tenacibaculum maritimum TaxID=107401 RepID=UPI001F3CA94C|nr:hypothetical protein [Tenacibaculum maritimum]